MSVRTILLWPDPRLSETAAPIDDINADVVALAGDLLKTMYKAEGRGLAAPQIGDLRRIFVMDAGWKDGTPEPIICINPVVLAASDQTGPAAEGCLSIPGVSADVIRPTEISAEWTSLEGEGHRADLTGFEARCFQHELDHLNGCVTLDHLSSDDRARVEAEYNGRLA